jgi:hypothetical protein
MFLQELNDKEQRDFLELATYAMKVDGDLHDNEINIINTFRLEMGKEDYNVVDKELDYLLKSFRASTKKVKKVVLIELFGVILADGVYGDFEKEFVEEITKIWEMKKRDISKIQNWVEDFNELVSEGYEYITS